MFGEGFLVKAAVIPGVVLLATDLVPKILNAGVKTVIVTAAVFGGLGMIGKVVRRSWCNSRDFIEDVRHGLTIVKASPERFDKLEAGQAEHAEVLKKHARIFDVIADADEHRIKDAIAGDERSPVDRRAA